MFISADLSLPLLRKKDSNGTTIGIFPRVRILDDLYGEYFVEIPLTGEELEQVLISDNKIEQGQAFQTWIAHQIAMLHADWVKVKEQDKSDSLSEEDILNTFGVSSLSLNTLPEIQQ